MKKNATRMIVMMVAILIGLSALNPVGAMAANYSYVEATGQVNIRTWASVDADLLGSLAEGFCAEYAGDYASDAKGVRWYQVYYKGQYGWISSKYAKLTNTNRNRASSGNDHVYADRNLDRNEFYIAWVYASNGDSNVRRSPNLSGKLLGTLYEDDYLQYANESSVDERGVRWYKVYYDEGYGWISSMFTELE